MIKEKKLFYSMASVSFVVMFMLSQALYAYQGQAEHSGPQFEKIDRKVGEGKEEAEVGNTVNVHYTGWLYDESAAENLRDVPQSSRGDGLLPHPELRLDRQKKRNQRH